MWLSLWSMPEGDTVLKIIHNQDKSGDTWPSSSYYNELQKEDKAKYKGKLTLTNGKLLPDPYGIVENWKSNVKLMPMSLGWHVQLPCKFT